VRHRCSTCFISAISYLFSFKFSLLLVSKFCNARRFSGDYKPSNWKEYNKFVIVFVVIPYPLMLASCALFVYDDGFWSYAGFVAIELVIVSSAMVILALLDALGNCACKTAKKKSRDGKRTENT
jgi:hypothetical protein